MSLILPVIAFLPLLGAAVAGGIGGKASRWVMDTIVVTVTAATVVLASALVAQCSSHRVVHWFSGWTPQHGIALGVAFVADGLGAAATLVVGVLGLCAAVFSWRYLEGGAHHFHVLMLLFIGGMVGFALAGDLFIMFVFFEVMSVAAYALTGMKVQEPAPLQGAINFAVINSVGSFTMLLGIGLVYGRTGALNFAQVGQAAAARGAQPELVIGMVLVMTGLLVKAAVVPFHFWLADAHAVAPTPVCVLFSGIMVELAVFMVARVYWSVFSGAVGSAQHSFGLILVGGGVASMAVGSVMCFSQHHLKRLLAFSTISHAGLALVGVGLMSREALAGTAVYIAGHGAVKAALFMLAGLLLHRFESLDEVYLQGRGRRLRAAGVLFAIGGLALAGLPPFATELGRALIDEGGKGYPWLPWAIGAAEAITGGAVLRAAGRVFLGLGPDEPEASRARQAMRGKEDRETTSGFSRTPAVMLWPAGLLLVVGLGLGLVPHLAGRAQAAAGRFQDRAGYISAVLNGHDVQAHLPVVRVPPSGVYDGLAAAAAAVLLAGASLYRDRASVLRDLLRPMLAPVGALRSLHTGDVRTYVVWFSVGLTAFGGFAVLATR